MHEMFWETIMDHDRAFRIPAPFIVSLSGGRTSAFMLKRMIDAHGGSLPDGCLIAFANTGLEQPETIRFVSRMAEEWKVNLVTLEYKRDEPYFKALKCHEADMTGKPFAELLERKNRLPSVIARFCTNELKIQTIRRYAYANGFDDTSCIAIGIRYDEPRRAARLRDRPELPFDYRFPLYDARVNKSDVLSYWKGSNFDLGLPPESNLGNCNLCFLKRTSQIVDVIRSDPNSANWWIQQEEKYGQRFNLDRPKYSNMVEAIRIQPELFAAHDDEEQAIACHCTD